MATASLSKLSVVEKSGYAMGDMAANLVWRAALAYLAVFYTDTLGISAAAAAFLLLSVRITDGITDIGMGMLADRTKSRHGRFRPWIIWSAPILALFMVLAFTAPNFSPAMKLVWAYFTYIGLTLAYTVNNVPYSALMGVMTSSHTERSVLSGYRFAGAFLGGMLVSGFTPSLVEYFGQGDDATGYQYTMYIFAGLLLVLCSITFATTKERIVPPPSESSEGGADTIKTLLVFVSGLVGFVLFCVFQNVESLISFALTSTFAYRYFKKLMAKPSSERSTASNDLVDLMQNIPWLLVLALGFLTMMFNGIKFGVIAYYFKHFIGGENVFSAWLTDSESHMTLVGLYFILLLMVSFVAALVAGYLTRFLGKKILFSISLIASGLLTGAIYFLESDQVVALFVLGCSAEFFAAFMPVLVFSMLGDCSDFSEWKNGRRATGLAYSAGSFIQKTGGGFAGALVLLVLANYGYVGTDESTIAQATDGMRLLMSWIPAVFSFAGVLVLIYYPLNTQRMAEIEADLVARRG